MATLISVSSVHGEEMNRFCQNVANGRFVSNPRSCQHWIFCQNQVAIEGQCEGIFYFDVSMQMCRYPSYVNCQIDQVDVTCGVTDLELHPHPENCDQYVVCVEGFPRVVNCAPGLHWAESQQRCDVPANAQCANAPAPDLNYHCDLTRNYVTLHPNDCQKFIICINGDRRLNRCADGLLFDPVEMRCDFKENVSCIEPGPGEPGPGELYQCDPFEDFYMAPHPLNCNYFFICAFGSKRTVACADGLQFDWISRQCNLPELGFCLAPQLA